MRSEDGQWSTGDDYDSGDVWLRGWASTVVSLRIRRNDRCPRQSSIIFPIGSVSLRRANQITSSWLFLYIFGHKIQQKNKSRRQGMWPFKKLLTSYKPTLLILLSFYVVVGMSHKCNDRMRMQRHTISMNNDRVGWQGPTNGQAKWLNGLMRQGTGPPTVPC